MGVVGRERRRKLELLERYRAVRLDEMLADLEAQAESEAEHDRYPWKGAFRSRDEILGFYKERKKLDRRFMIDMLVVVLLLAGVVLNGKRIISMFAPRPTLSAKTDSSAPAETPGTETGAGEAGQGEGGKKKTGEKKARRQAEREKAAAGDETGG